MKKIILRQCVFISVCTYTTWFIVFPCPTSKSYNSYNTYTSSNYQTFQTL